MTTQTNTEPLANTPAPVVVAAGQTETKPETKVKRTRKAKDASAPKATKTPRKASNIASTPDNPAKSIVPVRFKQAYAAHNDTCGDRLSLTLKEHTTHKNADGRDALDVPALRTIAKANGVDFTPYEGLNNGQKRMNVRNKLAGMLKAGKKVTIGKQVFANADKALAKPVATEAAVAA